MAENNSARRTVSPPSRRSYGDKRVPPVYLQTPLNDEVHHQIHIAVLVGDGFLNLLQHRRLQYNQRLLPRSDLP